MTTMGGMMLVDIWPTFAAEGALSTASYVRKTIVAVSSTNLISGTPSVTTFSTGITVLQTMYRAQEIDGDRIQRNDRLLRFPVTELSLTPLVEDLVTIGTVSYRVLNVGQPTDGASWALQVRNP